MLVALLLPVQDTEDTATEQVMLYMHSSAFALRISLTRLAEDNYQYQFQVQASSGVIYSHIASAEPINPGDSRTVLFRFDSVIFDVFIEEVFWMDGSRSDVTGDASSFTNQVSEDHQG